MGSSMNLGQIEGSDAWSAPRPGSAMIRSSEKKREIIRAAAFSLLFHGLLCLVMIFAITPDVSSSTRKKEDRQLRVTWLQLPAQVIAGERITRKAGKTLAPEIKSRLSDTAPREPQTGETSLAQIPVVVPLITEKATAASLPAAILPPEPAPPADPPVRNKPPPVVEAPHVSLSKEGTSVDQERSAAGTAHLAIGKEAKGKPKKYPETEVPSPARSKENIPPVPSLPALKEALPPMPPPVREASLPVKETPSLVKSAPPAVVMTPSPARELLPEKPKQSEAPAMIASKETPTQNQSAGRETGPARETVLPVKDSTVGTKATDQATVTPVQAQLKQGAAMIPDAATIPRETAPKKSEPGGNDSLQISREAESGRAKTTPAVVVPVITALAGQKEMAPVELWKKSSAAGAGREMVSPTPAAKATPALPAPDHAGQTRENAATSAEKAPVKAAIPGNPSPVASADKKPGAGEPVADGMTRPPPGLSPDAAARAEVRTAPLPKRENVAPPYPSLARQRGYEGLVILAVEVLASGVIGNIMLKKTSGYAILDRTALEAVRSWRFDPGKVGTNSVDMTVDVPIRYVLKSN